MIAGTILIFIPAMGMFVIPDLMGGAKTILIGNVIRNQFLTARDWPFRGGGLHDPHGHDRGHDACTTPARPDFGEELLV